MKTKQDLLEKMASLNACRTAIEWVSSQDGTAQEIWDKCDRGDWMLWFSSKTCDPKVVGLAACACARESLKYVPVGEDSPLICIEKTEAYWNGKATIEEVNTARAAVISSAFAYTSAVSHAASHAVANYDASASARPTACSADIVRTFIPEVPL